MAAGLVTSAVPSSLAEEAIYCVTCKNPDHTYVCRVNAAGMKASDALKLYCVIRTAKEGHHASCSAERDSPNCRGAVKVYNYEGPIPSDIAQDPRIEHFTDRIKRDQQTFDDKPKGDAPKTLVELTGRAVGASREGLRSARSALGGSSADQAATLPAAENAPGESPDTPHPNRVQRTGSAVSGLARKSYRCVMSFFRNCSGEPDDAGPVQ